MVEDRKYYIFMKRLIRNILFVGLALVILLSNFIPSQSVLAASANLEKNAEKVEKAADKIVQDKEKDTTKEIFGQYETTNEVIDKAREKAKQKLESMANTVKESPNAEQSLPPSQKNFIKKVGEL